MVGKKKVELWRKYNQSKQGKKVTEPVAVCIESLKHKQKEKRLHTQKVEGEGFTAESALGTGRTL